MEVDQATKRAEKIADMRENREEWKSKMHLRKKKVVRPMKMSVKSKVISKGTSYHDKYEIRRAQRLSGKGKGNSNSAINRLGQKHDGLRLSKVKGIAMTQAEKKKLLKKKARADKLKKASMAAEDIDWESASSDDEENAPIVVDNNQEQAATTMNATDDAAAQ